MRWFILLLLGGLLMLASASPSLRQQIQERLLGTSVQVVAEKGNAWGATVVMGSGTVFKKNGKTFVLTAAHVIEEMKQVVSDMDEDEGKEKKRIVWRDVWVVLERVKDGRKTGELRLLAKIRFATKTEEEGGDDVAVLEVYEGDLLPYSAVPLPKDQQVWVGQECWHVGSLYGAFVNSVSKGIISAVGRLIHDKPFHQTSTTAAPGSSGGGFFVVGDDGQLYYAGMLTRGTGQTVNFVVPIERIRAALKEAKDEVATLLD
jgi:S1-C subfamily serine protease